MGWSTSPAVRNVGNQANIFATLLLDGTDEMNYIRVCIPEGFVEGTVVPLKRVVCSVDDVFIQAVDIPPRSLELLDPCFLEVLPGRLPLITGILDTQISAVVLDHTTNPWNPFEDDIAPANHGEQVNASVPHR
jgi:hypothetical protein